MTKVVCLDYDDTYNLSPANWDYAIVLFREVFGWEVILCTYRHKEIDWHVDFLHLEKTMNVPCYFSDGAAKKDFLEEQGIKVDIWIDDNPRGILEHSAWPHGSPELEAWRVNNRKNLAIEAGS